MGLPAVVFPALAFSIAALPGASDPPVRPSVLWITAEDLSPDLGSYGSTEARTPNLDKLAAEGARFARAFAVAGVCAPSRSAIITGMYPTTIGTHHMRSKAVPPPFVKCFTEYLRAAGYYCTNNSKTDYNFDCPLTAWDENGPSAHWRGRAAGQPFFSVFNLFVTHESQIRASPEAFATITRELSTEERHDPARAILPPYYPDTPLVRKDWARYHDLVSAMDRLAGNLLRDLAADGLADSTVVFFFGDHGRGLPRAKRWLYDAGIRVPLLVRWPGHVAAGSVREDLVSLIDLAPTLLSIAGVEIPAHFQGRPFLGPRTGAARQQVFAHRDRMDETYDIIRAVRDARWKYIRNFQPQKPYAQFIHYMDEMPTLKEMRRLNKEGALEGPQKLFFLSEKPEEELYDTEAEPHEVENLSGRPEHRSRLEEMRRLLERWMVETGDLGLTPEKVLRERARPAGVWSVASAPVIAPSGGSPGTPPRIELCCPTPGASIAYTLEEGPQARWRLYTTPIVLERSAALRARACRLGWKDSPEVLWTAP